LVADEVSIALTRQSPSGTHETAVAEAAAVLGVNRSSTYAAVRAGQIPQDPPRPAHPYAHRDLW